MVYPALLPLMRKPRPPVVDWTDAPRRFKWTRPFRRKTKCGFCARSITFQKQSTSQHCCNWLIFVMQANCVLFELRSQVLYRSCGIILVFKGKVRDSIPGHILWDLKWTKWHYDRFFSEYFRFLWGGNINKKKCSIIIFVLILLS